MAHKTEAVVQIKLSPIKYRFVRRELEMLRDKLSHEYETTVKNWGNQNPDRVAFYQRIKNLDEILKEI
jgi:hypothetical protein